nr:MAG: hypothetical protein [Microvirus sp.]
MDKIIDNKEKIDKLFKELNFNAAELKTMYNRYNSPLKFKEFLSYYDNLMSKLNILYNYIKKLEESIEVKEDSYYNLKLRIDNLADNIHNINHALVKGSYNDLKKFL